jgi:hypothetical protein
MQLNDQISSFRASWLPESVAGPSGGLARLPSGSLVLLLAPPQVNHLPNNAGDEQRRVAGNENGVPQGITGVRAIHRTP